MPGRPVSSEKLRCFEEACKKMENDSELYTISEFHKMMKEFGDETYTAKMSQEKLKNKYGNSITFCNRKGKSNLIIIDKVKDLLSDKWYYQQHLDNLSEESERIVSNCSKTY